MTGGDELTLTKENIFETFKVRMSDESKLLFTTGSECELANC